MHNWVGWACRTEILFSAPLLNLHLKVFTKLHNSVSRIQNFLAYDCVWGSNIPLKQTCVLLTPYIPPRTLRSSDKCLLETPSTSSTSLGDHAFSVAAPVLWNSLPLHLRQTNCLYKFKQDSRLFYLLLLIKANWLPFFLSACSTM